MKAFGSLTFSLIVLGSILVAGLVWIAGDIFALFVVAFFLAYIFDPLAKWLVARGMSRTLAALLITGGMVVLLGAILAAIGPIVYAQAQEMIRALQVVFTTTMTRVRHELLPYFPALSQIGLGALVKPSDAPAEPIAGPLALSLIATVGLTMLVPVVTFYLLKDWPSMLSRLLDEVPVRHRAVVKRLARKIDAVLAGFLRGQAWVCLCVGLIYTTGFLIAGLKYAVAIGMIAGALKFLPYVGTAIAFVMAFSNSVGQGGWDGFLVVGILITFAVAEFIESSILSPRIIGNRVKLAPALVIFAVLVGGKVFGVIGVFIAIPVFAVGRVLLSFWMHRQRMETPGRRAREKASAPKSASAKEIRLVHDVKP